MVSFSYWRMIDRKWWCWGNPSIFYPCWWRKTMNIGTCGATIHHGVFDASSLQRSVLIRSIWSVISIWLFVLDWFPYIILIRIWGMLVTPWSFRLLIHILIEEHWLLWVHSKVLHYYSKAPLSNFDFADIFKKAKRFIFCTFLIPFRVS